jgi:D-alanyl-lipoteichoic acid acyltransferase DltB (MBOAT superfamily)
LHSYCYAIKSSAEVKLNHQLLFGISSKQQQSRQLKSLSNLSALIFILIWYLAKMKFFVVFVAVIGNDGRLSIKKQKRNVIIHNFSFLSFTVAVYAAEEQDSSYTRVSSSFANQEH